MTAAYFASSAFSMSDRRAAAPAAQSDANGWTPVPQSAVPALAITGIQGLINSGGAAWQPYSGYGPQSPPVASPGAYGPEGANGPPSSTDSGQAIPPFYAMDNATGQFYQHA